MVVDERIDLIISVLPPPGQLVEKKPLVAWHQRDLFRHFVEVQRKHLESRRTKRFVVVDASDRDGRLIDVHDPSDGQTVYARLAVLRVAAFERNEHSRLESFRIGFDAERLEEFFRHLAADALSGVALLRCHLLELAAIDAEFETEVAGAEVVSRIVLRDDVAGAGHDALQECDIRAVAAVVGFTHDMPRYGLCCVTVPMHWRCISRFRCLLGRCSLVEERFGTIKNLNICQPLPYKKTAERGGYGLDAAFEMLLRSDAEGVFRRIGGDAAKENDIFVSEVNEMIEGKTSAREVLERLGEERDLLRWQFCEGRLSDLFPSTVVLADDGRQDFGEQVGIRDASERLDAFAEPRFLV